MFLTKSGDLGVVLALDGVDYECLDTDQREAITRRFEVALRVLDDSMRLSQYVLKRNQPVPPHVPNPDPLVDSLLATRHRYLQANAPSLFALSLYAVIVGQTSARAHAWPTRVREFVAAPLATLRNQLSTRRSLLLLDEELERLRQRLLHKVAAFTAQLQDTVRPRVLGKREAFHFFRQLLNYETDKANSVPLSRASFVDYDLVACTD